MRGLVTMNINDGSKSYNKFPIVMYYDGKADLLSLIKNERDIMNYIIDDVISLSNIRTLSIAMVTYLSDDIANTEEKVEKHNIEISKLIDYVNDNSILDKLINEAKEIMFGSSNIKAIGLSKTTVINGVRMKALEITNDKILVSAIIKRIQET